MTTDEKSPIRILVAEDDPVSGRVLEVFLKKRGFEVLTASNGTEALEILEKEDGPRLAILDWMMPGLEGVQVCQRVRERNSQAYVYLLLLSAKIQKEDFLRGLDSGADDYLTKPFDPQELHARLRVGMRILDLQDSLIAAREELRFRASHDSLTGVANRGTILEALRRETSRQIRAGGSFGIIMVDLDHFKKVNDTHGHPCGDAVLQEAAGRMTSSVRGYDLVGRYGGEEFLIVVPGAEHGGHARTCRENSKNIRIRAHCNQRGRYQDHGQPWRGRKYGGQTPVFRFRPAFGSTRLCTARRRADETVRNPRLLRTRISPLQLTWNLHP